MCVVGARPQFVKEAALSPVLRSSHEEIFVNTGQHYDYELCQAQFEALEIPEPDYDLGVGSASHAAQTAAAMVALEKVLQSESPDFMVLYGDTNSTLAGALTAAKLGIPIGHVEAGPRQFDLTIPEEINRVITDRLATLLFAPTMTSVANLEEEGITEGVHFTGDVMYDIFLKRMEQVESGSRTSEDFGVRPGNYLLLTLHRPHNSDFPDVLKGILEGVTRSGEDVLFPMHPRTRSNLERFGLFDELENTPGVHIVKPVDYLDMLMLMRDARIVVTDSGGVNKEAFFCGTPAVCFDKISGWPETVASGWCVECGSDADRIALAIATLEVPSGGKPDIFGDGRACEKIVEILSEYERSAS